MTPAVSIQLMDGYGVLWQVTFGTPQDLGDDGTLSMNGVAFHRFSYPPTLPPEVLSSPAPWHMLAFDVDIPQSAMTGDDQGQFTLRTFAVGRGRHRARPVLDPRVAVAAVRGTQRELCGPGFLDQRHALSVRMTPTFDQMPSDQSTPPVVISQRMADLFDLAVGKIVTFSLEDAYERTNAVVKAVVPAIPGADQRDGADGRPGLVLHCRLRIQDVPVQPSEFWIDTATPDTTAAALRPVLPPNTRMQSADDPAGRIVLGARPPSRSGSARSAASCWRSSPSSRWCAPSCAPGDWMSWCCARSASARGTRRRSAGASSASCSVTAV